MRKILSSIVTGCVFLGCIFQLNSDDFANAKPRYRSDRSPSTSTPRPGIVGTRIRGITQHGKQRIQERNLSGSDILGTIRNGTVSRRTDDKGRTSIRYQNGKNVMVTNKSGQLVTGWKKK